jgi:methionyl-tRNA formyltransferase
LLDSDIQVTGVVTNPDKPSGRGMKEHAPPVKELALEAGLDVYQPKSARAPEVQEWLEGQAPDVAPVVAYGKILPADLLAVPGLGFVNVHFSLLPLYRGAAPVQRAVMEGATETGISIMVLTAGMDEGPVLAMEKVPIGPDETAGELGERLAERGGPLLVEALKGYASGDLKPVEQDHERATYAAKITDEEAQIDWSRPAREIHDHVRGVSPQPGAWTTFRGERLKVHRTKVPGNDDPAPALGRLEPGEVRTWGKRGVPVVGTADGLLELAEVQMATKKRMDAADAFRGVRPEENERFG